MELVILSHQRTPGLGAVHIHGKNYLNKQGGEVSYSRLPSTELLCSGKGAKFDNILSPRQHRIVLQV